MNKFWIKFLIFIVAFFAIERICYKLTSGFMVTKVHSHLSPSSRWHVKPPSEQEIVALQKILEQPFTFLGKGNECYVFESKDGRHVLKLYKHQLFRMAFIQEALLALSTTQFKDGLELSRQKRIDRMFTSTQIAFNQFKEETGLLAVNLAKDWKIGKTVHVIDRLGISHHIALDTTEFVLQRKVTPARVKFKQLQDKNDIEGLKECLLSILAFMHHRAKSGILNRDLCIGANFGFIENKAFEIDLGSFVPDPNLKKTYAYKRAFLYDTFLVEEWLAKDFPELVDPFQQLVHEFFIN